MSARTFVDTNILIYAHDTSAGDKQKLARYAVEAIWASGGGVLSTQVLEELSMGLRTGALRPISAKDTQELIRDYMTWEVVTIDAEAVLEALALEDRYDVPFREALIVYAATKAGVEFLLSDEIAPDSRFSFRVVNPLTAPA